MEPHDAQDHPQVRAYQRTSESGVPSRPRLAERAARPSVSERRALAPTSCWRALAERDTSGSSRCDR